MKLTAFSHGAGCACKIGPAQLAEIRDSLPVSEDPNLLVGINPADDAAVYQLTEELAIVQTIDFFTPIVDCPFDFGRIAAANALSDIYAMGATPSIALNVVAFSLERLGANVLREILRGGAAIASEAGVAVAGGHSIDDPEPKYGMAVTGTVDPARILTKAGAEPGDLIVLTKPVGSGLITTAAKRGLASPQIISAAVDVMTTLNDDASEQARKAGAHAMTDVTGFGLIGHLHEMCTAGKLAAEVDAGAIFPIDGALDLAADPRCRAGGSRRNAEYAETFTRWGTQVAESRRILLVDAMTSGGLLAAIPEELASLAPGVCIGRFTDGPVGGIDVK